MLSRVQRVVSAISITILFTLTFANAQATRGTINGHVVDSTAAVVANAKVQLQPGGLSTNTDQTGDFRLQNVAAGRTAYAANCASCHQAAAGRGGRGDPQHR